MADSLRSGYPKSDEVSYKAPSIASVPASTTSTTQFYAPDNSATAKVADNKITFSYADSYGRALDKTLPLLTPADIVKRVQARMKRFSSSPLGTRESDASRSERKYIVAHPLSLLKAAWSAMNSNERSEFASMTNPNSYHGISDTKWLKQYAKPHKDILGDDGKPL